MFGLDPKKKWNSNLASLLRERWRIWLPRSESWTGPISSGSGATGTHCSLGESEDEKSQGSDGKCIPWLPRRRGGQDRQTFLSWVRESKTGPNKQCLKRIRAHHNVYELCFALQSLFSARKLCTYVFGPSPDQLEGLASPCQEENWRGALWRISNASRFTLILCLLGAQGSGTWGRRRTRPFLLLWSLGRFEIGCWEWRKKAVQGREHCKGNTFGDWTAVAGCSSSVAFF